MPPRSRTTTGCLPTELSSFVGRRRELSEIKRLLTESRLVTLTGPGGMGKTRLGVRVGADLRRTFADGVWFVDLTQLEHSGLPTRELQDPDVPALLVAATLGLRERDGGSRPLEMLVGQLADRQMLLILDNCEQLLPANAIFTHALLRGFPGLRVLATSREPLAASGETVFAVPPLPVPDPSRRPCPADLHRSEAVALFLARAEAVQPGFGLGEDNHLAVAELCHRLDGLPLAIELAAARVPVLTPRQMLDRLTDRFTLLSRGSRITPPRQRTLRACVDWSYELCAEPEQILWARLSVFAARFELDAVEGICADEQLPEADLLDLLAALMDKSILVRDDGRSDTARYRMLETIRDYGRCRLREAGEDAELRRRHRDWYAQLTVRAHAGETADQHGYWLTRLVREQPNLRAAVEFCLTEPGEATTALRVAVCLPRYYWAAQGVFGESRKWLDRALAQAIEPTALRAQALLVNSQLAFWQGDITGGTRLLEQGEALAQQLDAAEALAHATYLRGLGALIADDLPVAVQALHRTWTMMSQDPDRDLDLYLTVLLTLGPAAGLAGDHDRANACQRELLTIVEPRDENLYRATALWAGGLIAWLQGELGQAAEQELAYLRLIQARESQDHYYTGLCLQVLAWITADRGQHRRAATLLGAADARWGDIGATITSYRHLVGYHDLYERQLRTALGDAAYADAGRHGRSLSYQDAIDYALDEQRSPAPTPLDPTAAPLTRREQQIADLIAQGLSNKNIAAKLVISQRTAESHVQHILTKLGLTSRAHVAAWITEHTRSDP